MTANELRRLYIEFFKEKGHTEISGAPLAPQNDPTVLFTTAGMHPLVPYLLGAKHPAGNRLVDYQRCIRTIDIENVGDSAHLTFFEMLGNWSLGEYFKEEAIRMSWEFLTSPDWLGIDPGTISVTVFAGDNDVPPDEVSAAMWKSLGVPASGIYRLGRADNWWGPAGEAGPCGPDTEMFIDTGIPGSEESRPGISDGKYLEIWNDVFMEYNKLPDGRFEHLSRPIVDTGMGIERTITILQGKNSVYDTELFTPIISLIEGMTGVRYGENEEVDVSIRIIADHLRTATHILGDEAAVCPSNVGQGYILRRLIRRAVRHGRKLGLGEPFVSKPAEIIIDMYSESYPNLVAKRHEILLELRAEAGRFMDTLRKGEHEFEKMLPNLLKNPQKTIPGRVAFRLFDTYGFPIEITEELATEHDLSVDREGFDEAYRKHQEKSKTASAGVFKGGLADNTEMTTRLHTATHLLHQALRDVLGDHVGQKGSNITQERLRFDFTHPEKMTGDEVKQVESIVNDQIESDLPVDFSEMTLEGARNKGAIALFGDKYDEIVKVYTLGGYSREVCGGPHVGSTAELGHFRIVKEQSSSHGVRRIRAVLE
ncbi:MAG: alanine--tRNA ligase [Spirochaetia bacterium]